MRCHGYNEGCECSNCLDRREYDQREWDDYVRQQEQELYDAWARDQEASYWAGVEEEARQRREAIESWHEPEPF